MNNRYSPIRIDVPVAQYHGKGNALRQQRRRLGISARQQKRMIKAARRGEMPRA